MKTLATDKIRVLTGMEAARKGATITEITAATAGVSRARVTAALDSLEADCLVGWYRSRGSRRYSILTAPEQAVAMNRQNVAEHGREIAAALHSLGFRATTAHGGTEIRMSTAAAAALLEKIAE